MTTPVQSKSPTTAAFFFQSAASFAISTSTVVIGIAFLPVDPWVRGFLAMGLLFTVSSAFTLAKCVRDRQEEAYVASRVDRARVDKLIADHDPFKVDV
ncbi:YiaA/YiaB family inner membrane protein [Actinophytocola sp.]|uniref:YiaA/YiaB family inner membrane protein n=1 Tax=Actinophytocola sp. TaxID=1872138 RepID=UPI003D6C1C63